MKIINVQICILIITSLLLGSSRLCAQTQSVSTLNVNDGTTSVSYNSDAILDMQSASKGLLLPRISLSATTLFFPLSAFTPGMVVYNTATAGDVTPGYYVSGVAKWIRVADAAEINNIYTTDGTLTAARTVTIPNTYTLTFNNTGSSTQPFIFSNGDALVNGITIGLGENMVSGNTALGASSLGHATGSNNTAVGSQTLKALSTAHDVTAVGANTLSALTTGDNNTAVGGGALNNVTIGVDNTAVGVNALNLTSGDGNTAIGRYSLQNLDSYSYNTAVGLNSLMNATGGTANTALGKEAGKVFIDGDNNVFVGANAADALTSSSSNNVMIGASSGLNLTGGDKNIAIGYNTGFPSATGNYQLNIGNCIFGSGLSSSDYTSPAGKIGINIPAPTQALDVKGNVKFSGALMPNGSVGTSGYVLTSQGGSNYPVWTNPATLNNIYTADGKLTAARTVDNVGFALNFTGASARTYFATAGIDFPGNTRYGVAKVYPANASSGDMYGMEQVSAVQTGDQAALRLFTSGLNGNSYYIAFGKYTNATAFTEFARFTNDGKFGIGTTTVTSTLHVNGSVAAPVSTVSAAVTLDATHYTVITTGNTSFLVTLPTASTCTGRIYVIVNTGSAKTISSYNDLSATASTTIAANSALWIQSTGSAWQQIK